MGSPCLERLRAGAGFQRKGPWPTDLTGPAFFFPGDGVEDGPALAQTPPPGPQSRGPSSSSLPPVLPAGQEDGQQVEGEKDAQAEEHPSHVGLSCWKEAGCRAHQSRRPGPSELSPLLPSNAKAQPGCTTGRSPNPPRPTSAPACAPVAPSARTFPLLLPHISPGT